MIKDKAIAFFSTDAKRKNVDWWLVVTAIVLVALVSAAGAGLVVGAWQT